jgi:hypothetical protein
MAPNYLTIMFRKCDNSNYSLRSNNLKLSLPKGPVIIYGGGWHRREMFFVVNILLTQPLKNQIDYPTSNIN